MRSAIAFAAGFAAGWLTRSTMEGSRSATVQLVALWLDVVERIKRTVAIEREHLEDVVAEAQDAVARRRAARAQRRREAEAGTAEHAA